MPKPLFLVSDVHLGAVPEETEAAFRRWLRHAAESASRLVINGDLFDFWFEYRRVVPGEHVRVLALLADVAEAGVPVMLIGGNHDWWGGDFMRRRLGVDFRREPVRLSHAGKSILVAHGDGVGRGDLGYRALKLALRSRASQWAFRWLHPDLGAWVADRVSSTRAEAERPPKRGPRRAAQLTRWAREELVRDRSLDIVALGHVHQPLLVEAEPGRYYVNSGDWVRHRTYVEIGESGEPRLHEWTR